MVGWLADWPAGGRAGGKKDVCRTSVCECLMSAVRLASMCAPTRPHMCLCCPFMPTGICARWRLTSDTVASASGSSVPSTRALATSNPTFAALHKQGESRGGKLNQLELLQSQPGGGVAGAGAHIGRTAGVSTPLRAFQREAVRTRGPAPAGSGRFPGT